MCLEQTLPDAAVVALTKAREGAPLPLVGVAPTEVATTDDECACVRGAMAAAEVCDAGLVARAKLGGGEAFGELHRRHRERIFAASLGVLKNPTEAEDVVQDTFLSAFESIDSFRGEAAFSTWLFRVARNHALMRLRKKRPEPRGDASELPEATTHASDRGLQGMPPEAPDDVVQGHEVATAVAAAWSDLEDGDQDLLAMRTSELPLSEIAERLAVSVPAVKSRLFRARQALRAGVHARGVPLAP